MFTTQPTPRRRTRALLAATITLLLAPLLGPSSALADTISLTSIDPFPTVGEQSDYELTTVAYADGTAHVYVERGQTACPATAYDAWIAGWHRAQATLLTGDGTSSSVHPSYTGSTEGSYLFCGYVVRSDWTKNYGSASMFVDIEEDADAPLVTLASSQVLTTTSNVTAEVSCPRACSLSVTGTAGTSSAMDVPLGTATATVGTFGGSATVQVPLTFSQRRDLRARISAGERVRADLLATATYPAMGWSFTTSATTQLRLLTVGSGSLGGLRMYRGV